MVDWIVSNYEWIFSGIGVALLVAVFGRKTIGKSKRSNNAVSTSSIHIENAVNVGAYSNNEEKSGLKSIPTMDFKANTHILFIDDERFNMINILKQAGWKNIEYKKDIVDLHDNAILSANVIFVDINGVGCTISKKQGLGLAAAIKDKHPNKYVVIYSAESNGNRFDSELRKVDDCLPKNAEPIQFMNLIEDFSNKLCNGK